MIKKNIAVVLLCINTFLYTSNIDAHAFAGKGIKVNGYIKQYAKKEMEKHTTKLKKEIEMALNKQEIFDEELETLSDKDINQINEAKAVQAVTTYYQVNGDEAVEVSRDKVDEYLEDYKTKEKRFDWLNFGIKKASAAEGNKYLKVSLTYCEYKNYLMVYCYNTWVTQPKNRYNDFYGIITKQTAGRFDLDSQEATYTYKYKEVYKENNKTLSSEVITKKITPKSSKHIEYLSNMGKASPYMVGARVNLKNNVSESASPYSHYQTVTAQTCSIKAKYLKRKSKYVDFSSFYGHGKKSYTGSDLSVGVSFSVDGPAVSVTYTPNNKDVTNYWTSMYNATLSIDEYCY